MRNKPWGAAWAALAGAAFACCFSSCDPASEVGLNVLETDVPAGATYVEYAAEAATIRRTDSVRTANKDNFLVGALRDANVGLTTAEAYLQMAPNSNNPSTPWPPTGVIDSLVLSLGYSTFYGTADGRQQLAAYELTEGFADDKAYYASSSLGAQTAELGHASFLPRYDTLKTTKRVLALPWVAGDTTTKKITTTAISQRPVRIVIENTGAGAAFRQKLYNAIGTSAMNSLQDMQAVLKGIVVKPSNGTQGAIANFNPLSINTKMVLYYRALPDTTKRVFNFEIGNTAVERHFTHLQTDFSTGTKLPELATAEEAPAAPTNDLTTYLQNGVELGTRLRLPGLADLKARRGSIVINRAELFIPVHPYSSGVYPVPSQAYLYQLGTSNRPLKTNGELRTVQGNGALQTGNNSPAILSYDGNQRAYRVVITSFLDAYLNDKLPDQSLQAFLLTPTLAGTSSLTLNRALLDAAPNRIKLKIYYSTLQ